MAARTAVARPGKLPCASGMHGPRGGGYVRPYVQQQRPRTHLSAWRHTIDVSTGPLLEVPQQTLPQGLFR